MRVRFYVFDHLLSATRACFQHQRRDDRQVILRTSFATVWKWIEYPYHSRTTIGRSLPEWAPSTPLDHISQKNRPPPQLVGVFFIISQAALNPNQLNITEHLWTNPSFLCPQAARRASAVPWTPARRANCGDRWSGPRTRPT